MDFTLSQLQEIETIATSPVPVTAPVRAPRPHHSDAWTVERVAKLQELHALKPRPSTSQMARAIGGVTRNAICGKLQRLGLSKRQPKARLAKRKKRSVSGLTFPFGMDHRPAMPTPAIREELPVPQHFLGVAFFDLQSQMCRYPKGEGLNTFFCGQPKAEEGSYCPGCKAICTQPIRKLELSDSERARRRNQARRNLSEIQRRATR